MKRLGVALTILAVCGFAAWGADDIPKSIGKIEMMDPGLDALLPADAEIEVLAGGHDWLEGPVWVPEGGYLLYSDVPLNQVFEWKPGQGERVYLDPSGYTGPKTFDGKEPGSNGLVLDSKGRLVLCCHGDRCIARIEPDGIRTKIAAHYKGKRLNSPNDLVFDQQGALYFTDPAYGLPKGFDDPARQLDFCGVYRVDRDGMVTLITKEMTRPNGVAFSPDYKTLYVNQSDPEAPIVKAFPVKEDGTIGEGRVFFDASPWAGKAPGLPDGMVVDAAGNVWTTGPGGVWVVSPEGKVLGRIFTGQATANCTFGDDGSTLYITADMYLCKVKTKTKGLGF